MSAFVSEKSHLRETLPFLFHLIKNATESNEIFSVAYGNNAFSLRTCQEWFTRFKSGNFDLNDKEHGKPPKIFEDVELQALLDDNDAQTQEQLSVLLGVTRQAVSLRLQAMGKIQKEGKEMGSS